MFYINYKLKFILLKIFKMWMVAILNSSFHFIIYSNLFEFELILEAWIVKGKLYLDVIKSNVIMQRIRLDKVNLLSQKFSRATCNVVNSCRVEVEWYEPAKIPLVSVCLMSRVCSFSLVLPRAFVLHSPLGLSIIS